MNKNKKDATYIFRMTEELKKASLQYSRDTGRTLAGLITLLLEKELDKAGYDYITKSDE